MTTIRELTREDVRSGLVELDLNIEPEPIEVSLEEDLLEAFPGDPGGPAEDVEADAAMRAEIARRVRADDHWAYCTVNVVLTWNGFDSVQSLGRCSYRDEADFRAEGGYFDDMVSECLDDLNRKVREAFARYLPLLVGPAPAAVAAEGGKR